MTVNIDALINSLGKPYQDMLENELIPYKSPPKGSSGTPTSSLDMAQEGGFLSFFLAKRANSKIYNAQNAA